ncbi:MAG: helix-turn-helix domain-containing protein [Actinomycetota bacterium]
MEPQPLLNIEQAAKRLGVDVRFVRRLVFEKRLPYVKVGKFVRFEPSDIEAWIADRRVESDYRRPA